MNQSPSNGFKCRSENTPFHGKWVQVDLGSNHDIQELHLFPAHPTDRPSSAGYGFPPRFSIELSKDQTFKESERIVELTAGDFAVPGHQPFIVHVNNYTARFVRVTAHKLWKGGDEYLFALAELQVWCGNTNVAFKKNVAALDSSESDHWSKRFLVDGFTSREKLENQRESD